MTAVAVDSVLSLLLSYAELGIPVLPVWGVKSDGSCMCPQGMGCTRGKGKHPRTVNGVKNATVDRGVIEGWWKKYTGGNWAIATGHQLVDGRYLCVLDVDPRNGGDESLRSVLSKEGDLPVTPRQATGGGGTHFLFATTNPPASCVLGSGLDLQGVGKYALVEPSGHASGARYMWSEHDIGVHIADAPEWILAGGKAKRRPELSGVSARASFLGEAFFRAGMLGVELDEGKVAVKCPWAHQHSDSRGRGQDSSTAILPPAMGTTSGGFNCQHSHCAHRKWADVVAALPEDAVAMARKKYPVRPSLADGGDVAAPVESDERQMADELILNKKKNVPEPILYNCVRILTADTRWANRIRYNAFSSTMVVSGVPIDKTPSERRWTDTDDANTQVWCRLHYGVDFHIGDVARAVDIVAKQNQFHPVLDYLNALVWDGVPRVDTFLPKYFSTADNAYTRGVGRRWLISAVARVMEPGCQVDCLIILEGRQGIGKSTALRTLAGVDWFFDGDLDIGDKDARQNLKGKWIVEWAELDSLSKGEINKVKKFITNRVDEYRPSFGKRPESFPRQCVMAGTTNETAHYLKDPSGNRRFLPVTCLGPCDVAELRRDRDQIWAEAVALYRAGHPWHVDTPEFRDLCQLEQVDRLQTDPWETPIEEWLSAIGRIPVTTYQVLTGPIGMPVAQISKADEMRVATILKHCGYIRSKQVRINPEMVVSGKSDRTRLYVPVTEVVR